MVSTAEALKVGITVDDKTKKGFDSAKKNVSAFEKTVKNLAKTLGVALSAQAVGRFARTSVQAFLDDEAAATKLGVAVKNLGYEFAQTYVTDYISNLEKTAKVADDDLRPAFQALLQQTGSLTQAQSLLNTAISASRGSGESLVTVANDLAQAYVGNTKGLKKYYLGLDQATLKTMSFVDIQKRLNDQFSGANEAYLNTYAGQVTSLGIAWQNFQEQAGGALLMLASLGEGSNAQGLNNVAKALDLMGKAVTTIAKGATSVLALLNVFGKNKGILGLFNPYGTTNPLSNLSKDAGSTGQDFLAKYKELLAKVAAENKKMIKAQQDAAKKQAAQDKKNALLKKQSTLFDIEQIQLIAALKGKLSDEDRKRVELQLALLQGNEEQAAKLSKEIANSIDKTGNLAKYLQTLPDANNPFKNWDAWIETFKGKLGSLGYNPLMPNLPSQQDTSIIPIPNAVTGFAAGGVKTGDGQVIKVDLQVDGKTLASVLQNASLSGNQVFVDRLSGRFYE